MAKIKNGGAVPKIEGSNIEELAFVSDEDTPRQGQMWINGSSLSHLTIDELLNLRDEINEVLHDLIS